MLVGCNNENICEWTAGDGYGVHTKGVGVGFVVVPLRAPQQSLNGLSRAVARSRLPVYPYTFCTHPYALFINITYALATLASVPSGLRLRSLRSRMCHPVCLGTRAQGPHGCASPLPANARWVLVGCPSRPFIHNGCHYGWP